jgi:hypothetical protein
MNGIAFAVGFSIGVLVGVLAIVGVVSVVAFALWRSGKVMEWQR